LKTGLLLKKREFFSKKSAISDNCLFLSQTRSAWGINLMLTWKGNRIMQRNEILKEMYSDPDLQTHIADDQKKLNGNAKKYQKAILAQASRADRHTKISDIEKERLALETPIPEHNDSAGLPEDIYANPDHYHNQALRDMAEDQEDNLKKFPRAEQDGERRRANAESAAKRIRSALNKTGFGNFPASIVATEETIDDLVFGRPSKRTRKKPSF